MRMKIIKYVFATFEFEMFAVDFHGDDFLIAQDRRKAAAQLPTLLFNDAVLIANVQKNNDNETVQSMRTSCE